MKFDQREALQMIAHGTAIQVFLQKMINMVGEPQPHPPFCVRKIPIGKD